MSAPRPSPARLPGLDIPNVTMRTITRKGLLRHRARFALTAVAVAMSVAFFTAVLLLTSSLNGTATRDIAAANAGVEAVVRGAVFGGDSDGGPGSEQTRYALPAVSVDQVRAAVPGATVEGVVSVPATFTTTDGDLIDTSGLRARVETWTADADLNTHRLIAGRAPQSAAEVVVERRLATQQRLTVGSTIGVATDRAAVAAVVSGIADFATVAGSPRASLVFVSRAQSPLVDPEVLDRVLVRSRDTGATLATLRSTFTESPTVVVTAGEDYVAELQRDATRQTSFISSFLTFFAVIALIAGTTIIYNTFVISVQQRTKEIAMLRAIGTGRRQVLRSVLGEAALIGVIASVIGVLAGLLLSRVMAALFKALGLSFLSTAASYPLTSLLIPFVVGVLVTVASALMPARRAASVAPMAALRDQAVDSSRRSRPRTIATMALMAATAIGAVAALAAGSGTYGLLATGSGLLVLIIGGPLLVTATSSTLGRVAARLGGEPGRIANVNLARNPRRSASTSFSLSLGLALIVMFTAIASSISGGVAGDIRAGLRADTVLAPISTSGPTGALLAMPDGTRAEVAGTAGVTASTALEIATAIVDGDGTPIGIIDPPAFAALYDAHPTAGTIAELRAGQIAVYESTKLDIGDSVIVQFSNGAARTLIVAAVFNRSVPAPDNSPRYLIGHEAAVGVDAATVAVFASTDRRPATLDALQAIARRGGAIRVLSKAEFVTSVSSGLNDFRNFVYALLAIALLISLVGIANTSMMSINERRREIGVMRAIGTTARQVRRIIRIESVLLAVHGCALGIALGLAAAASLITLLGGTEGLTLTIPWRSMATLGAGGMAAGVLASAWPAWQGSRADLLDAIASE